MKAKEYRERSEKEILKIKKKLEFNLAGSYGNVKPRIKKEQRSRVRRELARINTVLNEK